MIVSAGWGRALDVGWREQKFRIDCWLAYELVAFNFMWTVWNNSKQQAAGMECMGKECFFFCYHVLGGLEAHDWSPFGTYFCINTAHGALRSITSNAVKKGLLQFRRSLSYCDPTS